MASPRDSAVAPREELALYHPWPSLDDGWSSLDHHRSLGGWMKNMLLFFDGVAILAPPEAADRLTSTDEETMIPLVEQSLVRLLPPREMIDDATSEVILAFLFDAATSSALDEVVSELR